MNREPKPSLEHANGRVVDFAQEACLVSGKVQAVFDAADPGEQSGDPQRVLRGRTQVHHSSAKAGWRYRTTGASSLRASSCANWSAIRPGTGPPRTRSPISIFPSSP